MSRLEFFNIKTNSFLEVISFLKKVFSFSKTSNKDTGSYTQSQNHRIRIWVNSYFRSAGFGSQFLVRSFWSAVFGPQFWPANFGPPIFGTFNSDYLEWPLEFEYRDILNLKIGKSMATIHKLIIILVSFSFCFMVFDHSPQNWIPCGWNWAFMQWLIRLWQGTSAMWETTLIASSYYII